MITIIRISSKLNYNVVCFISRKHLLNKTNRYRFIHKCSFIKKQPCIRDTKRHQNNFLPEKVTEQERDEHLRYVSFDTRNHSLRRNYISYVCSWSQSPGPSLVSNVLEQTLVQPKSCYSQSQFKLIHYFIMIEVNQSLSEQAQIPQTLDQMSYCVSL